MAKDTKEKILTAALDLFSQKGYEGTNIRELSASLGLVKSGIYKHFESKEAIWDALLDRMIAYYGERFGSSEHLPPVPDSTEEFIAMHTDSDNRLFVGGAIRSPGIPFWSRCRSISRSRSTAPSWA